MALNRGFRFGKMPKDGESGVSNPEFYVFPTEVVKTAQNAKSKWGKVAITKIPNFESYKSNWSLIANFLEIKIVETVADNIE